MKKHFIVSALIILMALISGCQGKKPKGEGGNPIPGNGPSGDAGNSRPRAKQDSVLDEKTSNKSAPAPFVDENNPNVISADSNQRAFNEEAQTSVPAAPPDDGTVTAEPLISGSTLPATSGVGGQSPFFNSFDGAAQRSRESKLGGVQDPSLAAETDSSQSAVSAREISSSANSSVHTDRPTQRNSTR